MPVKTCCYKDCTNSTRKSDLRFIKFIKPHFALERAKLWVKNVGIPDFEIESIGRCTYITASQAIAPARS